MKKEKYEEMMDLGLILLVAPILTLIFGGIFKIEVRLVDALLLGVVQLSGIILIYKTYYNKTK